NVHDALARELGVGRLNAETSYDAICGTFLVERYDLWNNSHGTADYFIKLRLSLIELLFRAAEEWPRDTASGTATGRFFSKDRPRGVDDNASRLALDTAVRELNNRFRRAEIGLHYHNGLLQFAQDDLTQDRIAEPCWSLLQEPKWA